MKKKIDNELEEVCFSHLMREKVICSLNRNKKWTRSIPRGIVLAGVMMLMSGIVVLASYFTHPISINGEKQPELDEMNVVKMEIHPSDIFISYDSMMKLADIKLLDSDVAGDIGGEYITRQTDYEDYCVIKVEDYFVENEEKNIYSPVSLEIHLILSEEQLSRGWEIEYLGYYEHVETYVSKQGYRVNILESIDATKNEIQGKKEKRILFVADGIRYILKGKMEVETAKMLVDSME